MRSFVFPFRPTPLKGVKAYVVAFLASCVAAAVSLLLAQLFRRVPFMPFFGAVAVSAWFGRTRHGMFSSVLAALFVNYLLFPGQFDDPYGL
ncbi:MAG TPA: DUF4118 domain-containing protein, partial [Terriglobales bacterium]|nr:DUF4118 domain-containing protein [Terriglobales bacterium]